VLDEVLLVGSKSGTSVGRPFVAGARVRTIVEQQTRGPKVIIFRMRRRKNSRKLNGFRAAVTQLRIMSIVAP
jgi:large subunit ribosomal protein L21